jgi:hypothetical protein
VVAAVTASLWFVTPVPSATAASSRPTPDRESASYPTAMRRVDDADPGRVGIMIMDVPAVRITDPRARNYIIDSLKPGSTIRRRIGISNSSSTTQHVDVYAVAATIENDTFTAADGRLGNDLSGWVSLESPSVEVPPGSRTPLWVTISVPDKASEGERYAAILAEVKAPATGDMSVTKVNRVGVRMYLNVGPGGEPPTAFTVDGVTVHREVDQWPVVTAQVHNTGARAIDMIGSLTLSNADFATKAGPFKLSQGATILPGGSGEVAVRLDKPLVPGMWDIELTLASGTLEHTATATLHVPGPVPRTPWWRGTIAVASATALVIIVGLLFFVRYLLRRRPSRTSAAVSPDRH